MSRGLFGRCDPGREMVGKIRNLELDEFSARLRRAARDHGYSLERGWETRRAEAVGVKQ